MLTRVATAEKERQNTEINLLNSGPIGRAQVERVAALNARIEELESQLSGRRPVRHSRSNSKVSPCTNWSIA